MLNIKILCDLFSVFRLTKLTRNLYDKYSVTCSDSSQDLPIYTAKVKLKLPKKAKSTW